MTDPCERTASVALAFTPREVTRAIVVGGDDSAVCVCKVRFGGIIEAGMGSTGIKERTHVSVKPPGDPKSNTASDFRVSYRRPGRRPPAPPAREAGEAPRRPRWQPPAGSGTGALVP